VCPVHAIASSLTAVASASVRVCIECATWAPTREEGLPVYRLQHARRGSVFAYRAALEMNCATSRAEPRSVQRDLHATRTA
jgi:hypothetical protein